MTNELKDAIEKLLEQVNEAIKLETEWYRHMLSLAAGALALLAGLSPAVPADAVGRYLLAATWVFLGAGILTGAGATYYGARRVRLRSQALAKQIDAHVDEGKPLTELTVHKNPVILTLSAGHLANPAHGRRLLGWLRGGDHAGAGNRVQCAFR